MSRVLLHWSIQLHPLIHQSVLRVETFSVTLKIWSVVTDWTAEIFENTICFCTRGRWLVGGRGGNGRGWYVTVFLLDVCMWGKGGGEYITLFLLADTKSYLFRLIYLLMVCVSCCFYCFYLSMARFLLYSLTPVVIYTVFQPGLPCLYATHFCC